MRRVFWLPVLVFVFFPFTSVQAEIYSWIDNKGNKHITDDFSKVPEAYRDQAYKSRVDEENEESRQPVEKKYGYQYSGKAYKKKKTAERRSSDDEPVDKYGRGEEYWQERAEAAREYLQEQEDMYEYVSSQERACLEKNTRYASLGKHVDCTAYQREKIRAEKNIAKAKKSLEVDLPEEARKAEAYPGWIRQ
jgi:hypothetical protein